jgi:hypothetical protein
MVKTNSSDVALEIISHLEQRLPGFRRSAGALKRAQFSALQADVARIIDGQPVEWQPKAPREDDVEIEDIGPVTAAKK